MESLRWILLAVGIAFVLVIYLLGRSRRQRKHSIVDALEDDPLNNEQDGLPEFSARNLDNMDEGVGEVRILSGQGLLADEDDFSSVTMSATERATDASATDRSEHNAGNADADNRKVAKSRMPSDIIVLFILPKPDRILMGSQINSAAQAMGLTFGDMNIFHYKPKARNVFSLANMLEPGSFNPETIHDIETSGLTVFMQISAGNPLDDLTEMLQRSYQLAGLLDARLCNHKREPLTEQDAENYRTQVSNFVHGKTPELSAEA